MGIYDELAKLSEHSPTPEASQAQQRQTEVTVFEGPKKPPNRDTTTPRHRDTTTPRYHDTIIELVRKAVKEFGKEAATHRFTLDEKRAIADIIYSYTRLGIKTSENEVTRIAVNFLIKDYKQNGENSVLDKVLKALKE